MDWGIQALAEGKFMPLFALLFGAGFTLFAQRVEARGGRFVPLYARRLLVLALFGLLHGALIWAGDILLLYALGGALLLLFRHSPPRRQFIWAGVLLTAMLLLVWMAALSLDSADGQARQRLLQQSTEALQLQQEKNQAAEAAFASGDWWQAVQQTSREFADGQREAVFSPLLLLPFFLLGRVLVQTGLLREPHRHPLFLHRLIWLGLTAGLLLSLVGTRMTYATSQFEIGLDYALGFTLFTLGAVLLMLGYMALLIRLCERLSWLAPVGRMALTNYLLQSLVWTWVFYGYGLGLWGRIPRLWHPGLAVVFFMLQVGLSHWWMARFQYGPLEWLWRSLTYLQRPPLRK